MPSIGLDTSTAVRSRSPSRSPPDANSRAVSSSLTTTVFSQRSMRWFDASPRRATPKGQQSFISCTAPRSITPLPQGNLPRSWHTPVTQRFPVDTQPVRHPGDRPLLLAGLLPDLEHHPHGPLTDLVRVLLRCWHDSYLRKVGSLQRTRGGSTPRSCTSQDCCRPPTTPAAGSRRASGSTARAPRRLRRRRPGGCSGSRSCTTPPRPSSSSSRKRRYGCCYAHES